jgi:hypothetical protein
MRKRRPGDGAQIVEAVAVSSGGMGWAQTAMRAESVKNEVWQTVISTRR